MWLKWVPWKYLIRTVARRRGFVDPVGLLSHLSAISQPSHTVAPIELLRAGLVLHARGFVNNTVIQHNLDWVWPQWVERQFNPDHPAFIPRAFSLTHINLTHRNWTAVGYPGCTETPIVDAAGLLMPFFDSWSLDGWFLADSGEVLIPSRMPDLPQRLETGENLRVVTEAESDGMRLTLRAEVVEVDGIPMCRLGLRAQSSRPGWLAASIRPYNPEGISFIRDLAKLPDGSGWEVDGTRHVRFSRRPDEHVLSRYRDGDAYQAARQRRFRGPDRVRCDVGMATGAALFRVGGGDEGVEVGLELPLAPEAKRSAHSGSSAAERWRAALEGGAELSGGPELFARLWESSLRLVLLLSQREIYAGPYTYKRFWYRDAAIIAHALMCAGRRKPTEQALDYFVSKQSLSGYFMSQEGEWDSNGQVLWALGRYCRLFAASPKPEWLPAIRKGVHWVRRKRVGGKSEDHAGLLPAGFSAEHLGPNDYYYWDDFWTVAGLRLAAEMLRAAGDAEEAAGAAREAASLEKALERSLRAVAARLGTPAMPASPHRRMDSGAVGSLAAGFPLQLRPPRDPALLATADYLWDNCLVRDAFYHDISHSGINPYLSLHLAQCLLRSGDPRFRRIMEGVAALATPTGHWPEAVHPRLGTGCMGDGQHAWAAAEWLLMVRNCFLFEEEFENRLVLAGGLSPDWCADGPVRFGPAPTRFGTVTVGLETEGAEMRLTWSALWHGAEPELDVRLDAPGWEAAGSAPGLRVFRRMP